MEEERKAEVVRIPRWTGRGITIKGKWLPIESLDTKDLVNYLNELRDKPKLTAGERKKMKYLGWLITWRNRKPEYLPKRLRYKAQKWDLDEVTEYNYPESIYELSILYRLALLKGGLSKINLIHDILLTKGYIYRPAVLRNLAGEWEDDKIEKATPQFTYDDMKILYGRGLKKKKKKPK